MESNFHYFSYLSVKKPCNFLTSSLCIRMILESLSYKMKNKTTLIHLSKRTTEFADRNFLRESILFNVHRNLFCASPKLLLFRSPFSLLSFSCYSINFLNPRSTPTFAFVPFFISLFSSTTTGDHGNVPTVPTV